MNTKKFGIGVISGTVIVAASMYWGMTNYPQHPSRTPDLIGEFQRVDSGKIIVRPLDKKELPFEGMSREEIRKKMRNSTKKEREDFRKKMKESLRDEVEVSLAEEVIVTKDRRKSVVTDLESEMAIMIWYKQDGSNEAEFVSTKRPPNKIFVQ